MSLSEGIIAQPRPYLGAKLKKMIHLQNLRNMPKPPEKIPGVSVFIIRPVKPERIPRCHIYGVKTSLEPDI